MRNKIYLLITVLFFTNISFSQTPNFTWAKQVGGTGSNFGQSVKIDATGNVYSTGYFTNTSDFDPGAGTTNLSSFGLNDIYISKLDASGNLLWAKQFGGTSDDYGYGITIDASNNIYITGSFSGTADFDPGVGTYTLTSAGSYDIFICKLSAAGNFIWAKKIGGATADEAKSITVDGSGNVFTTGDFSGTVDFNPGAGTTNLVGVGSDIFISKLDSSGNYLWAGKMGGNSATKIGQSIKLDASNNIYVTGFFAATQDFDPSIATSYTLSSHGGDDIFVAKLSSTGAFIWAKGMGGTGTDQASSLALDVNANIFITGFFNSTVDFDPSASIVNLTTSGAGANQDMFVCKLDVSGNFGWAKQIGGGSSTVGYSIALDNIGNIYTTGFFYNTNDFDPGAATQNLTSNGGPDIFISKLDPAGNYIWAGQIGGTAGERAYSLNVDANNNLYATGYFQNTVDFDAGAGVSNLSYSSSGTNDGFIIKYCNQSPNLSGTISGLNTLCASTVATYSIPAVTDATSYTWSLPGGWSGTSTTNTISATAGLNGMVSVTAGNSCGSSSAQAISVTVHALPTINTSALPSASICIGNNLTLSGSGASTYTWSNGITDAIAFTPTVSATYTVTGTDANGCVNSTTQAITVNNLPNITASVAPSATICAGNNLILTGSGASTYTWSGNVTDATAFTPTVSATYTVNGTDVNGCVNSATTNIIVNNLPNITTSAAPSATICAGNNLTLTGNGAITYTWSNGVTDAVAFTPTISATYTVNGTDANGCINSTTQPVTVNNLPNVTLFATSNTVCANGSPLPLTGSPAGGTYNGTGVTGSSFDPTVSGVGTFTLSYSYTDVNTCSNTDTFVMTVSGCTGVSQISGLTSQVSVYPNPFTSIVTLSGFEGHVQVTVHNMLGEKVAEFNLEKQTQTIDLSDLVPGIYYLKVMSKQIKLIKQ